MHTNTSDLGYETVKEKKATFIRRFLVYQGLTPSCTSTSKPHPVIHHHNQAYDFISAPSFSSSPCFTNQLAMPYVPLFHASSVIPSSNPSLPKSDTALCCKRFKMGSERGPFLLGTHKVGLISGFARRGWYEDGRGELSWQILRLTNNAELTLYASTFLSCMKAENI